MSGHFRKKALGFVLLMGAGILLGMQLAGSGLRSVYGRNGTEGIRFNR